MEKDNLPPIVDEEITDPIPRVEIEPGMALKLGGWNFDRGGAPIFVRLYDHLSRGRSLFYRVAAKCTQYYQDPMTCRLHISITVDEADFLNAEKYEEN